MENENNLNSALSPELAGKLVDSRTAVAKAKVDRGWIGIIFGTEDHIPNNVAAIVCVVSLLVTSYLAVTGSDLVSKKDPMTVIAGILTLSLGFLFGRVTKDRE